MGPAVKTPLRWFFVGALVASAAVSYGLALPLGVGAVLGYITERRVDRLLAYMKKPDTPRWRGALSGALMAATLLLVFLPVSIALYVAIQDLIRLLGHAEWNKLVPWAERAITPAIARLQRLGVELPIDQIRAKATELVTSNAGAVGGFLGVAITSTPEAMFDGMIILLGWYVFAVEGRDGRQRILRQMVPWPRVLQILKETTAEVIESVIIANILVSAVQAVICAVPLVILGVPRALVWAVLAFFLSFIPVVGTMPITLGAALWCFSQGRTGGALFMVIVAVFVGSVDNVLRPLFMRSSGGSSRADLSTLWLLVALTSGVSLFGLAGVILGPLAFSLFIAFAQALEEDQSPSLPGPTDEGSPPALDQSVSPALPPESTALASLPEGAAGPTSTPTPSLASPPPSVPSLQIPRAAPSVAPGTSPAVQVVLPAAAGDPLLVATGVSPEGDAAPAAEASGEGASAGKKPAGEG